MPPLYLQPPNSRTNTSIAPFDRNHTKIGYSLNSVSSPIRGLKPSTQCKLRQFRSIGELAANPVFLHRFHLAATQIQRVVRGRIGRHIAYLREQQQHRKHMMVLKQTAKIDAATRIQAMLRGSMLRSHFAVLKLELQLKQIETAKQRELAEIEAQKKERLQKLEADFKSKRSQLQKKAKKQQADFDMAKKIINYLRSENKKLREKNEALRVAIQKMVAENQLLARESAVVSLDSEKLSSGMMQVNDQNAFLKSLQRKMQGQIEAFQEAIQLRDDAIMTENRMGRSYFNSIQGIVLAVDHQSDDDNLIDEIDDLYSKMHHGKGLEETECDITENF